MIPHKLDVKNYHPSTKCSRRPNRIGKEQDLKSHDAAGGEEPLGHDVEVAPAALREVVRDERPDARLVAQRRVPQRPLCGQSSIKQSSF